MNLRQTTLALRRALRGYGGLDDFLISKNMREYWKKR